MQIEIGVRGRTTAHKLPTMKQDHHKFKTKGKGKKAKAAQYNNCIGEILWDVPVRCVCPPYLHILPGVVKRHHDLLESECHKLDVAIAKDIAISPVTLSDSIFHKHVQLYWEINKLKAQHREAIKLLEEVDESTPLGVLQQEDKLKTRIGQLDASIEASRSAAADDLGLHSGPITCNLEVVLRVQKIEIQAYHSRSFVGNHCSQYLKQSVFTDLYASIPLKTTELTVNPRTQQRAEKTATIFKQVTYLFSAVHRAISHSDPIPESDIDVKQDTIDRYLAVYRQHFPMKILPKHHILEDNVVPWIRRWGFGMGFHGEQGGETLHAEFNSLKRRHNGIKCPVQQILSIMKEHHTKTSPLIQAHVIQPKKRKLQ